MAVKGIEELKANLNRLVETVKGDGGTRAVMQGALVVERGAKMRAPVDTGKLRASIKSQPGEQPGEALIGTNVEYAPHQEFGTIYQDGTPFLRPTIDGDKDQILAAIAGALKEEIERAVGG